jgi:hypothetical protein
MSKLDKIRGIFIGQEQFSITEAGILIIINCRSAPDGLTAC